MYRYQAVLLREKFDKIMNENDKRKAVEMFKQAEQELFLTLHPIPKKCK